MQQFKSDLEGIFLSRKDVLASLRKRAWEKAWELNLPESFKKVSLKPLFEISRTEKSKIEVQNSSKAIVLPIEAAMKNYGVFLQSRIQRNIQSETHCFPLLTEALQKEGVFIYVPPKMKIKEPIRIRHSIEMKAYSLPRIQIFMGSESEAAFYYEQSFLGQKSASIGLIDVVVEANAKCRIEDVSRNFGDNLHMQHLRASVKRNGSLTHLSAVAGSPLFRQDLSVELLEEGASADLKGFWSLEGEERAHTQILITHKASHTRSNQHYKGVVRGKSRSTFEGKIYVHPEAQKTEAYQLNNNLVLDLGAVAYTKPNLEIFADDVKASHGATIAELSEEELFYLRARGMPEKAAKEALIHGFTHAIRKEFTYGL